jgi:hypothetical protein
VNRHLIAHGLFLTSGLTNFEFDATMPYTGCRLCGRIFQSELDRSNIAPVEALELRKNWSLKHAKLHTELEHQLLEKSGWWCTPEAAQRLASFGIVDIGALALSGEHSMAYLESESIPVDDAETNKTITLP